MQNLVSITHALSLKAASARVRRWRKWAQYGCVGPEEACISVGQGQRSHSPPCAVLTNGQMRADTQVLVDDEFRKWQCVWGEDPMADLSGGQMHEPLPRPSLTEARKAIRTFPTFTAVGGDEWEPWTWRHLSDGAIEALTDIGMAMENMMVHPRSANSTFSSCCLKPTGGTGPSGCRTQRDFIRCWQLSNARSYFWE